MSNDPKDAVVDLGKLMRSQSATSTPTSIPVIPVDATNSMITSCNEETNMIGHENFNCDDSTEKKKPK